ncbi:LOW QUALITY PROTEIN: hypothetical protein SETIT_9G458300v2 [Setaria italica]|uniref:Uncharacterized protein n=1 Tax=Setaria italica TaxID=4555 RepID=A0A368SSS6_SETIT|nr:LOW QUALITY PROTEIN: hypothetical protein SETIT_9G458300v2 [Setaria italica]
MWGTARHRSPGGSPAPGSLPPLLWKSDVAPAGEPTAAIAVEPDAAAPAGESAALAGTLVGEPATAAPVGGRAVPAAALAGEPVVAVAAARTGERAAPIAAPCMELATLAAAPVGEHAALAAAPPPRVLALKPEVIRLSRGPPRGEGSGIEWIDRMFRKKWIDREEANPGRLETQHCA